MAKPKAEPTVKRDLQAELDVARQQLAAAEAAAEALKSEEEAALADDAAYSSLERRKKLSIREIERLTKVVREIRAAIDDLDAEQDLIIFEKRYENVATGTAALCEQVAVELREDLVPKVLRLARDLAQNKIDTDAINRLVPPSRRIQDADSALRSLPSIDNRVVSTEIVTLWCVNGRPVLDQASVRVDDNGRSYFIDGTNQVSCVQRKFKRVERSYFRPARNAVPLWKALRIPSLTMSEFDLYDGKAAMSPEHAIQLLEAAIELAGETHEPRVATKVDYELDPDLIASNDDSGPTISS